MEDWQRELQTCRDIAALAERSGDVDRAVDVLRRGVQLLRSFEVEAIDTDRTNAVGEVCGKLGELLWEERLPEAVQAYQEAADAFGQVDNSARSVACAKKVVEG